MTCFMVMEFIFGKTKGSMLAYGKITKCMVMAFSLGLMVECIMEVTQTEKNMVLVHMNGLINENSLVIGRMANSMVMGLWYTTMKSKKVSGEMVYFSIIIMTNSLHNIVTNWRM